MFFWFFFDAHMTKKQKNFKKKLQSANNHSIFLVTAGKLSGDKFVKYFT
ncbi:MAG: hypothetical protein QS748_09590 [Candidatus Endonucleobacter bathymodioli]|uniref:Uncharacterized protein n=1 Tax=Candidatus Endonucleibacter bathymodioli TaxID=539814 RepID=A0AA90NU63_9GAMM|nr:hypothetical protein [Candidatus Endonucleobacter bathymodioli]